MEPVKEKHLKMLKFFLVALLLALAFVFLSQETFVGKVFPLKIDGQAVKQLQKEIGYEPDESGQFQSFPLGQFYSTGS